MLGVVGGADTYKIVRVGPHLVGTDLGEVEGWRLDSPVHSII